MTNYEIIKKLLAQDNKEQEMENTIYLVDRLLQDIAEKASDQTAEGRVALEFMEQLKDAEKIWEA